MINIHLCAFCWNFKVVLFYLKADVDHCFCCFGKLEISELTYVVLVIIGRDLKQVA